MQKHNESVRKAVEKSKKLYTAVRRSDVVIQVRQCMVAKGIKSVDLARRIGVSEANISRWLKGSQNLGLDTLYLLADAVEEPLTITIGASKATSAHSADDACSGSKAWLVFEPEHRAGVVSLQGYRDKIQWKEPGRFKPAASTLIGEEGGDERATVAAS